MKLSDSRILLLLHVGVTVLFIATAPVFLLGFIGVFAGLFTDAPYATSGFKLSIFVASFFAVLFIFYGFKHKNTWWGKLLSILAVWGFAVVGLIAFGPV